MEEVNWAAVQAVGSVLAILVAVGLSAFQHWETRQAARRAFRRQRLDRIEGIAALLEDVYGQLWYASSAVSAGNWLSYAVRMDVSRLERAVQALRDAPVHELGAWSIVSAVVRVREDGLRAVALLSRLHREAVEVQRLSQEDADAVLALFYSVNAAMRPVVRALAFGEFITGPLSEWKEHLEDPPVTPAKAARFQRRSQMAALRHRAERWWRRINGRP